MRLAATLGAVSLAAIATVARSFAGLLACLVVGGLANALAQPATNLYLARNVAPARLGVAFGVKQSAIPAATLLGGLAVPALALTVGWRWAFAGAALVASALAVADPGGSAGVGETPPPRAGPGAARATRRCVRSSSSPPGWALGAAAAGSLGSFLVSGAVDIGIDQGVAGLLSSGCSAAGLATRLVAGVRADRRGGRHLAAVVVLLAGGATGYALLATGEPALFAVGGLLGFCLGWSWPGLFNLAVVRSNPGAPGAATGITQTGTYIGAVAGPLLFGLAVDRWSYGAAWLAAGATSLAAAVAITGGRRSLVADRERRAAA